MNSAEAKSFVDDFYKKVAARWKERVTNGAFMEKLRAGTLPRAALRLFFKNWGAYTIEINTLEAASYHKHIHFFRKHRDLMAPMAQKLADELIHPEPPGHVFVVLETAKALGIADDEIFVAPMLAEFRAKIDFKRADPLGRNRRRVLRGWSHRGADRLLVCRMLQGVDDALRPHRTAGGLFFNSRRSRPQRTRRWSHGTRQLQAPCLAPTSGRWDGGCQAGI